MFQMDIKTARSAFAVFLTNINVLKFIQFIFHYNIIIIIIVIIIIIYIALIS